LQGALFFFSQCFGISVFPLKPLKVTDQPKNRWQATQELKEFTVDRGDAGFDPRAGRVRVK
jgi:hypothetical protein